MQKLFLLLSLIFISSAHTPANASTLASSIPHFDPQMPASEIQNYLDTHAFATLHAQTDPVIENILAIGTRLHAWVNFENSHRPADHQIQLTSPQTRPVYPISSPNTYNPSMIQAKVDAIFKTVSKDIYDLLTGTGNFPAALPMDDASFIKFGHDLDYAYQGAARWKGLAPFIADYTKQKEMDVRGYYYLNQNGWDAVRLAKLSSESASTQKDVLSWLTLECINSKTSEKDCNEDLTNAVLKNQLPDFYTRYHPIAKKNWDEFFLIPADGTRKDVTWNNGSTEEMVVPFNTPSLAKVQAFLKDNIEDEWHWNNWALHLNFGTFPNSARVEFKPGVVPHADELGGNVITMDQNASLDEYEVKWTIRHEFGHIIGFPDCYLEFYDTDQKAFVNYQLDTTDLMCSRAGNLKERHYLELKRVYD